MLTETNESASGKVIGGPEAMLLRVSARTVDEMIHAILQGLPTKTVPALADALGLPQDKLLQLVGLTPRAFAYRVKARQPLTPAEGERVARIARVTERAHAAMGREHGTRWLMTPWPALAFHSPLDYTRIDLGAEMVLDLLGALEDGIFS